MQIKKFNQHLVARHYDLGFLTGNFACNTRYTDPRRLTRLRSIRRGAARIWSNQLEKSCRKTK